MSGVLGCATMDLEIRGLGQRTGTADWRLGGVYGEGRVSFLMKVNNGTLS